jgi:diguanylate cyclase (GGDEF)-like protein
MAELEKISHIDPLTGLLNRRILAKTLLRETRMAERNGGALCRVYFDLDGFKDINHTHGHKCADVVLTGVAECLRMVSRNVDFASHLGGDEFFALPTDSTEALAHSVYCVCLAELVSRRLDGLRMSIGIAQTGPSVYDEPGTLILRADATGYNAKRLTKAMLLTAPMFSMQNLAQTPLR